MNSTWLAKNPLSSIQVKELILKLNPHTQSLYCIINLKLKGATGVNMYPFNEIFLLEQYLFKTFCSNHKNIYVIIY